MKRYLIILAATAVIAGCGNVEAQVEADYGKSVRAMINAQVADPNTLTNPAPRR